MEKKKKRLLQPILFVHFISVYVIEFLMGYLFNTNIIINKIEKKGEFKFIVKSKNV